MRDRKPRLSSRASVSSRPHIGYPKAIDLSNKKYKNKDMIIQSQIEEKDFVTGYGLELDRKAHV